MKLCSFSFLVFIALTEVVVGAPLDVRSGYSIPDITMSPDGKFGVAVPDAKHYREVAEWRYDGPSLHEIVEITSGRILGAIQGHSAFIDAHSTMGQGGLRPARWSADSSLLLWEIEGKWVPTSLILVKLKDGEILWQRNLLNTIQQEMLSLTKRAAGSNYPRAERRAYGDNPSYPEGFVIDVRAEDTALRGQKATPVVLPLRLHADLHANVANKGSSDFDSQLDAVVDEMGHVSVTRFALGLRPRRNPSASEWLESSAAGRTGVLTTPPNGSPERQAIMDALHVNFNPGDAGRPHTNPNPKGVLFKVNFLKVHDDWACTNVLPVNVAGKGIAEPRWELLHRNQERWEIMNYFDALRPYASDDEADDVLSLRSNVLPKIRAAFPGAPADVFPDQFNEQGFPVTNAAR